MARLLLNSGVPNEVEFHLKPGVNSLGRSPDNDFHISNASVSGRHCQFTVADDTVILKDLGSTNGTFIDQIPVQESALLDGQTVRVGDVEMIFHAEALAPIGQAEAMTAHPLGAGGGGGRAAMLMAVPEPPRVPSLVAAVGSGKCKHHPKTPARFFCPHCGHNFCELCVSVRPSGGAPRKVCRRCGGECVPVQTRLEPEAEQGFFARFPGAFGYPVRGVGVLIVIVGIVLFALLNWGQACIQFRTARLVVFGTILVIFSGGYLFTYLQCIIHSTTAGDRELPELPGIAAGSFLEDVLLPFFRLFGLLAVCFGPAIACLVWFAAHHEVTAALAFLAALGFGCVYFPMAFLAVAVLDSIAAANPLLVAVSVLRCPLEYLATLVVCGSSFGLRALGYILVHKAFPEGAITHQMGTLFALMGSTAVVSFLSLYLLIVSVHLLGLLYVTHRQKLAWLER